MCAGIVQRDDDLALVPRSNRKRPALSIRNSQGRRGEEHDGSYRMSLTTIGAFFPQMSDFLMCGTCILYSIRSKLHVGTIMVLQTEPTKVVGGVALLQEVLDGNKVLEGFGHLRPLDIHVP